MLFTARNKIRLAKYQFGRSCCCSLCGKQFLAYQSRKRDNLLECPLCHGFIGYIDPYTQAIIDDAVEIRSIKVRLEIDRKECAEHDRRCQRRDWDGP